MHGLLFGGNGTPVRHRGVGSLRICRLKTREVGRFFDGEIWPSVEGDVPISHQSSVFLPRATLQTEDCKKRGGEGTDGM